MRFSQVVVACFQSSHASHCPVLPSRILSCLALPFSNISVPLSRSGTSEHAVLISADCEFVLLGGWVANSCCIASRLGQPGATNRDAWWVECCISEMKWPGAFRPGAARHSLGVVPVVDGSFMATRIADSDHQTQLL